VHSGDAAPGRRPLASVAAGGAAGTALRIGVATLIPVSTPDGAFPVATLLVNLVATLALAVVAGRLGRGHALVATGLLGALSTFSTFAVEVVLLAAAAPLMALAYLGASVAGGVALARVGLRLAAGAA